MNSLIKYLRNSTGFYIFLLLAFFPPNYLLQNALLKRLLTVMKLTGFLLVCLLYFVDIRKHMQKTFNVFLLLLWTELFVSSLLSDYTSLRTYLSTAIPVFGLCFMAEEMALHSPTKGLKSMYIFFSACVLINTATFFIFPGAMYANNIGEMICWFLGGDNTGYSYYIFAEMVSMLYCRYIAKRMTCISLLVWICSFVTVFYRDIATGIVCQIVLLLLILGYRFGWFRKVFNAKASVYITAGGFLLLVVTRRLIIKAIIAVLHRNVTLSGRTLLWDATLNRILLKPFFGYGVTAGTTFGKLIGYRGALHAHNWLLMLTFYGGLTATLLFCLLFICACRKDRTRPYADFDWIIAIGLIVTSVRFLVEAGNMVIFYPLLAMSAYTGEFVENLSREEVPALAARFRLSGMPRVRLSFKRR